MKPTYDGFQYSYRGYIYKNKGGTGTPHSRMLGKYKWITYLNGQVVHVDTSAKNSREWIDNEISGENEKIRQWLKEVKV